MLGDLQWLRSTERIDLTLAVLVHRRLHTVWHHGISPTISSASHTPTAAVSGRQNPRSYRRTRLSTVGDRAFPVAGRLPPLEQSVARRHLSCFLKNRLKTLHHFLRNCIRLQ